MLIIDSEVRREMCPTDSTVKNDDYCSPTTHVNQTIIDSAVHPHGCDSQELLSSGMFDNSCCKILHDVVTVVVTYKMQCMHYL